MSIEGTVLENFSALLQIEIKPSTKSCPRHAVFHYFISDDRKQYYDTTTPYRKCFIKLLKESKLLTSSLIKIWENNDGCVEQYICASEIYLMLVMLQCYSVIVDRGISAPRYGKEVVDGINAICKHYIYI